MRPWIAAATGVLVFLGAGAIVGAQQDFDAVEIKTAHVAGKVHMLEGRGGNIGVSVGSDGLLIIDDQFAPPADKIRAALGRLGKGKLKFVLNTQWHGDHTGGNVEFGCEAPIIAHTNVRKRLASRTELFGRVVDPLPSEGLPDEWGDWGGGFIKTERWLATVYQSLSKADGAG